MSTKIETAERVTFGEREPFDAFPCFTPGSRYPVLLDGERVGTLHDCPKEESWTLFTNGEVPPITEEWASALAQVESLYDVTDLCDFPAVVAEAQGVARDAMVAALAAA